MDFYSLIASQRPDVIQAGVPIDAWWRANGAPELLSQLARMGRTDVVNAFQNNPDALKIWYSTSGPQEYQNVWQGTPAQAQTQNLATEYGAVGGGQAPRTDIQQWQNALPWETVKSQFQPEFQRAAEYYVAPEVQRNYQSNLRNYMNTMASQGGGRFGRAIGGTGSLAASAQRSLKEQMLDYENQYNQALKSGWYDPIGLEWNKAKEAGNTYQYTMPTANQYTSMTPPTTETPNTGTGLGSQYKQNTRFLTPTF